MSESRLLRNRLESLAAAGRSDESAAEAGSVAIVLQIKAEAANPDQPDRVFACVPCEIDGPDEVGAAAAFQADSTRTILAVCLGPAVPPVGAKVVGHDAGGRWVFQYAGGEGNNLLALDDDGGPVPQSTPET